MKRFLWMFLTLGLAEPIQADSIPIIVNDETRTSVIDVGQWPPAAQLDASNRASGMDQAIALGERLFFDPNLSSDGLLSCAMCHQPDRGFMDGVDRSMGRVRLDRNAPSLINVAQMRWFGWDGGSDNLWAQSILPILNSDELAQTTQSAAKFTQTDEYKTAFDTVFGQGPKSDTTRLVEIGKALAAFQETLISPRSDFDLFQDDLIASKPDTNYPLAAQKGAEIFFGKGNCSFCHSGPNFSNGEFHDAGVPYFIEKGRVDQGRLGGIDRLLSSEFTLDGDYTDDPKKIGGWAVRNVARQPSDFGAFRTPSLRGVKSTAPYMHNGSLSDLRAVVEHYNEIDLERLHADGEAILSPLGLTQTEINNLVAFLETL